jgi:hypothetical protein
LHRRDRVQGVIVEVSAPYDGEPAVGPGPNADVSLALLATQRWVEDRAGPDLRHGFGVELDDEDAVQEDIDFGFGNRAILQQYTGRPRGCLDGDPRSTVERYRRCSARWPCTGRSGARVLARPRSWCLRGQRPTSPDRMTDMPR